MTAGLAVATANSILGVYRGTAFSAITTPFIKLHITDPGASAASGASAGSTTRNAITWNAQSGGSMTLNTLPAWTNGGATETLSHVSMWDAATVGNFIHSFALTTPQPWVSTNTFTITTFTISYSPIAA